MFIKMLKTTKVSTTGLNALEWKLGKVYDAPEDLAINLCTGKLAVKAKIPVPEPEPELKADVKVKPAPKK